MKTQVSIVLALVAAMTLLLIWPVGAQRLALSLAPSTMMSTTSSDVEYVSLLAGSATGVAVQGDYAYVTEYDAVSLQGSLRIIDVFDPMAPTEVSSYPTPGLAVNVAVAGSYAYVADGLSGLCIINVSDPDTPTKVGSYVAQSLYAQNVAVAGRYAYVADFGGLLRVIDVSDPTAPTEVGFYSAPDSVYGVAVWGEYAYVAARDSGLRIVDVSNPAIPNEVSFHDTPGIAQGAAVEGDYVYVADYDGGLRIVDVSEPMIPTETGVYTTPGNTQVVAVARNYAYVAEGTNGLRIVDISEPMTPTEEILFPTTDDARDVTVADGYIYVADGNGGLSIFYFAPPSSDPIPPGGGELISPYDDTIYVFPPGTFTDTVIITHTPLFAGDVPPFGNLINIDHIFELTAVYSSTGQPAQPAPGHTFSMTVQYAHHELGLAIKDTLALYYWNNNSNQWEKEPTSSLDMVARTVAATPNHLSIWAVLGETNHVFLPLISKNH